VVKKFVEARFAAPTYNHPLLLKAERFSFIPAPVDWSLITPIRSTG
jgi:hypothetical protein